MKEKSFTLVELLAVIFIIGILAGLLLPAIGKVRKNAQISAQQAEIGVIETALESFYADYLQYPPDMYYAAGSSVVTFTVDNPDDPRKDIVGVPDTVDLDSASEVFYYYLCREWLKTTDVNGDGDLNDPQDIKTRIKLQIDPSSAVLEEIDVPGGNGSPYLTPKSDRIGDTDNDGKLELLDIWGNPYKYWNNADGWTNKTKSDTDHSAPGVTSDKHGHNEFTFDIYSFGPNRADNKGYNDRNFGAPKTDDDINGAVDDEDDVNNY